MRLMNFANRTGLQLLHEGRNLAALRAPEHRYTEVSTSIVSVAHAILQELSGTCELKSPCADGVKQTSKRSTTGINDISLDFASCFARVAMQVAQGHRDAVPRGIKFCNHGLLVLGQREELLGRMDGAQQLAKLLNLVPLSLWSRVYLAALCAFLAAVSIWLPVRWAYLFGAKIPRSAPGLNF